MIKSCCFYSIKQVLWCNFIHIFILKASTNVRIPLGNQSYKWIQSLHFIFGSCKVLYHSTYCQMCWNLTWCRPSVPTAEHLPFLNFRRESSCYQGTFSIQWSLSLKREQSSEFLLGLLFPFQRSNSWPQACQFNCCKLAIKQDFTAI